MGLLDDAIREHLELKRLRGADPGLVAREEHDAFGPVHGDQSTDAGADVAAHDDDLAKENVQAGRGEPEQASQPGQTHAFTNVGQETAELDMRTVLGEESDDDGAPVGDLVTEGTTRQAADDSLEWEMPGDGGSGDAGEHQDGDPHGDESEEDHQGEPVEDVLEETPDFLRDAPEQERLWFEQRPPRDFDFDK